MEVFGLLGLLQMECSGSDARMKGIHGSSQILCCRVYLALINAVLLYTQFVFQIIRPITCNPAIATISWLHKPK